MIGRPGFPVDPWALQEDHLHVDFLGQAESVFALANGHVGWRANLDEGEPHALPGSYLNGVHELRPLPYAEAGYGYPESGQTVVNVTNGKIIRLLVDDEPFDVRYGELRAHRRVLDFRSGLLTRTFDWCSPAGRVVRVQSTRLVSFTHRAIAAVRYQVQPLDRPARIVVQSELVANEALPAASCDPRVAAVLAAPLQAEQHGYTDAGGFLVHITEHSRLRVAAAVDHLLDAPAGAAVQVEADPDLVRLTATARLEADQPLQLVKFVSYGWSAVRSRPALRDQVAAALTAARHAGWQGLVDDQRAYLDDFWARADVELDGDPQIQQAVRFALFHVLQAGARAEGRAIPAKGLTGPGYDGHAFWDSETFVLPVLTYTVPEAAGQVLRWRHRTLPAARYRARELGLRGAVFPWRSITGEEASGYWPAGTAAFHVGADVADAVIRYVQASGDQGFAEHIGVELLTETARLWCSLGAYDSDGQFRIDGVTGPDEYSAIADNNVYTNLMAQRNLLAAADAATCWPNPAARLGVDTSEIEGWRGAARAMRIPFDDRLGVHPQADGFTDHQRWDFAATRAEQYPLFLHFPYFQIYRRQVVKQADLMLAMLLRGDAFSAEQKARNFAYYEALTVRDSSLSASIQSVIAAEVGHLDLAYDYLAEAALMDLGGGPHQASKTLHTARDGLHLASLAGTWLALVNGLGGMRDYSGELEFAPRLPEGLTRLSFCVCVRGRWLRVTATPGVAAYLLTVGEPMTVRHCGEPLTLLPGQLVTRSVPPILPGAAPSQPAGRAPVRRGGSATAGNAEKS